MLNLLEAAAILRKGGIVVYPTETTFGLGADPANEKALRKLFEIKKRDAGKPVLLVLSSPREVKKWAYGIGGREKKLMRNFWPGPLTLVFRARRGVSKLLTGKTGKIGLRVSSSALATNLARLLGGAVTSTSANLSGEGPPLSLLDLSVPIQKKVDGAIKSRGYNIIRYSTILDVSLSKIKVLREGVISVSKLITPPHPLLSLS